MSLSPSSCYFLFVPTVLIRTLQSITLKMLPSEESVKMRNSVQHFATCSLVKIRGVYEQISSPHCNYSRSGTLLLHVHGYPSQFSGSFIYPDLEDSPCHDKETTLYRLLCKWKLFDRGFVSSNKWHTWFLWFLIICYLYEFCVLSIYILLGTQSHSQEFANRPREFGNFTFIISFCLWILPISLL